MRDELPTANFETFSPFLKNKFRLRLMGRTRWWEEENTNKHMLDLLSGTKQKESEIWYMTRVTIWLCHLRLYIEVES